ncbi:MAG: aminotransferase class V-fold PLP-dependent enzyme [Pseudomonadales bacterium]|nr:aminotransferase class V-fold PLP-dependent enzyme [Pseudomonadales bacterium]MCP5358680.1 aminotransferase class V-fold PLP-dependent enzyme [Pseudomonadales bacterium]
MTIDIASVRADTPACDSLIHFNNAGASLSPRCVTDAVFDHLRLEQQIGGYEAANAASTALENFYHAFARMLHCEASEIAFAENATHAWNNLFGAVPLAQGDRILTGQSEYASNYLSFLHLAKRRGVIIEVIPNTPEGVLDVDKLEAAVRDDVKLIAITHVPSQSGVVHPAAEVGKIARRHGILYLLDACQSAGQIELDVRTLGCDMLTGTGRKYLRGPRGTGFLYIRRQALERLEPAWVDLHSAQWIAENEYRLRADARRFENWECFVAGKIGLGVAVNYALKIGLAQIEARVAALARTLRQSLETLPEVRVHEHGQRLSGIVTFSVQGVPAAQLQAHLQRLSINSSVTRADNSQLDLAHRGLGDLNRVSVHYYNTESEIARFCEAVAGL